MGRLDWVRRIAAYLVAGWCVWRSGDASYGAFRGQTSPFGAAALSIGLLTLAIGLLCMNRYARRVAAAFSLLASIIIPIGVLNPFAAMDYPGEPPALMSILAGTIPVVAGLLLLAWLLDPPRRSTTSAR
jgi:uncharacterized membrane protein HdeD (DUF308 family)